MISVVLSIGSNCGDRKSNIEKALNWLAAILMQPKFSRIYETPCAKNVGKPYMNAVIKGFYQGDGFQLEDLLKDKERSMGRDARCREKGDVPVDIDLVVCDGTVFKPWDYRQKFFQIGFEEIEH